MLSLPFLRFVARLQRLVMRGRRRIFASLLATAAVLGLGAGWPAAAPAQVAPSGAPPADARVFRAADTFYGRFGGGSSVSETDGTTYAIELYSLQGELGYQLSPAVGLGLGATHATYPGIGGPPGDAGGDRALTTLYGAMRWTLLPRWRVSPFMNVGPQVTLGGEEPGAGALFGLGVDVAATRRVSVFAEATAYGAFPDRAVDGRDDGRAGFDGLGFWGLGVRTTLAAAPARPSLGPIEGPITIDRGATQTFTVRADDAAARPIEYTWSFGDGHTATGLVADHRFGLEGTYPVTVTARNAGGTVSRTLMVTVREPQLAAAVELLEVDRTRLDTARVGTPVRFRGSVMGTAPVDISWDFGDGSGPASGRVEHAYDGERAIGTVHAWSAQSYTFNRPGTYKVTLEAANTYGTAKRSLTLTVVPQERAIAEAGPCDSVVPDTVFFAFDSAELSHDGQMTLQRSIPKLKACASHAIQIDGYTDRVGADSYNRELSARRALAVRDFYLENGIRAERIVLRPRGEDRAACSEASPATTGTAGPGCASARRVEAVALMDQPKRPVRRSARSSTVSRGGE
jgi:outer membrane protein OmpA-like peptidoglycan-associated protein